MSLLNKERRTHLFFRDDNRFQFIKRELEFSCLVEKASDVLKRGWKHFYGNQLFFPGYKKMSADTVTLGFARDIILDPFNKIPTGEEVGEKPDVKNKISLKNWIAKIAENQRHTYRSKRQVSRTTDIINWSLAIVLLVMIISWAITFLTRAL